MRVTRRRQVIVLGAGVGGLSAAIYARLLGHDVLVLDASPVAGGKAASVEMSGYRFDPGPSIIILTDIYEQLFRDAGRKMSDYLEFQRLNPISRVFHDGTSSFDLPSDREQCVRTVKSIAPADVEAFEKLFVKLDRVAPLVKKSIFSHAYDQPWQLIDPSLLAMGTLFDVRRTYRELIDGWFSSDLLKAFFYGFPSYGGQSYDSKAPGALLIPYLMIEEGVYYPKGGVAAIPQSFETLARELGVEFRFNSRVRGLRTNGRRVFGVELKDGEVIEGDVVISNVDRLTTRAWLGRQENVAPSFSYYTLQWGMKSRLSGLSHHNLVIPKEFQHGFHELYHNRRFPVPPIVYLNETSGLDPTVVPSGGSNLFAVVTTPSMEPQIDWRGDASAYRQKVIDQVRSVGIDFEESDIAVERVQSPTYFEEAHGNYKGSLYGPDERHRLMGGAFPLRNWDEEFQNLFYCGGSVQPGAGLPMVTLSGKFAVQAMQRRAVSEQ